MKQLVREGNLQSMIAADQLTVQKNAGNVSEFCNCIFSD